MNKWLTRGNSMRWILLASTAMLFLSSCSIISGFLGGSGVERNPDVYHVGTHEWIGDSIAVHVYKTSEPTANPSLPKIMAECRSCNVIEPAQRLIFSTSGVAYIYFPTASELISARIHLHGCGVDTTFIQTQRPPLEAMRYFHILRPLVGRVLVGELAPLYSDSAQGSIVASANAGDELNIYGEDSRFFIVQVPTFSEPLYLYKGNAVALN